MRSDVDPNSQKHQGYQQELVVDSLGLRSLPNWILISSLLVPYDWIHPLDGWTWGTFARQVLQLYQCDLLTCELPKCFWGSKWQGRFFCWDDVLKSIHFWKMLEEQFPLHHWKLTCWSPKQRFGRCIVPFLNGCYSGSMFVFWGVLFIPLFLFAAGGYGGPENSCCDGDFHWL